MNTDTKILNKMLANQMQQDMKGLDTMTKWIYCRNAEWTQHMKINVIYHIMDKTIEPYDHLNRYRKSI